MSSFAELERNLISERTATAIAPPHDSEVPDTCPTMKKGLWSGRPKSFRILERVMRIELTTFSLGS